MITHRPRVGQGHMAIPDTTLGLAMVTSMAILGVTISDDLEFENHILRICCQDQPMTLTAYKSFIKLSINSTAISKYILSIRV